MWFPVSSDADILDWTVDAAPFAEAPDAGRFAPVRRTGSPATLIGPPARSPWRLVAGSVAAVLVGVWLSGVGGQVLREWELRQAVAREEQVALSGDAGAVLALSDPAGGAWLAQRLDLVDAGQPAPLPIPVLRFTGRAGWVMADAQLSPTANLVRVDVARSFVAPDGALHTFALPQFYRRTAAGWRRVPAPAAFWGTPLSLAGRWLTLNVASVDEALARDLLLSSDDLLARACAELACPEQPLALTFSYNSYQQPELRRLRSDDPLLVGLLPTVVTRFPDYALLLPSPHDVGYPLNAAGQDLLRRSVATQLLLAAADRAAFGGSRDAVANAFFYALVARLAVRYGLDTPQALAAPPEPLPEDLDAEELWGFRYGAWRRPDIIRNAGWLLNGWLAGQPPQAEAALIRTLPHAQSLAVWLAEGLAISPAAAEAAVRSGLSQLPPALPQP